MTVLRQFFIDVFERNIPGDFIDTSMFARAITNAYNHNKDGPMYVIHALDFFQVKLLSVRRMKDGITLLILLKYLVNQWNRHSNLLLS
jgi:hypothetical protein